MYEHAGHRKRLRNKAKEKRLLEHEMLEMLLFNAIPRRNTNDLAHRLLAEFGDLRGVMNASFDDLTEVRGIGEGIALYLTCLSSVNKQLLYQLKVRARPKYYEEATFREYLTKVADSVETLDVYCLDDDSRIFHVESFTLNDSSSVFIESKVLADTLSRYSPSGVILTHNHPSGNIVPSPADDAATIFCQKLCRMHNILFCDHLIYSKLGTYSYYRSGKLSVAERINRE